MCILFYLSFLSKFSHFFYAQGSFVPSSAEEYNVQPLAIERSQAFQNDGSDHGIVLKNPAKRYAFTSKFSSPVDLSTGELLVIQYEVQLQDGLECGGAYVKAYNDINLDVHSVTPSTPYVIMFGPDRCEGSTNKVCAMSNLCFVIKIFHIIMIYRYI